MLTVLTPATSTALTTVDRTRQTIGQPNTDDSAVLLFIDQASRAIVEHCRRPFGVETVRETFIANQIRGDGPLLARSPVVEIVAVRDNNGPLTPGSYAVDAATGRLRHLDASGFPVPWWWSWGNSLSIDYRAGYVLPADDPSDPTLPEPVERACQMMVATYLSLRGRDPAVKSESNEGVGSTSWWVPGTGDKLVSPEAQQLLAPFVRYDR